MNTVISSSQQSDVIDNELLMSFYIRNSKGPSMRPVSIVSRIDFETTYLIFDTPMKSNLCNKILSSLMALKLNPRKWQ